MTPDDPVRLSAGGAPAVRELLRSARTDDPSPARLEHAAARLGQARAAAAPAGGLGAKAWLAIALVGGAALVAGLPWSRSSSGRATGATDLPAVVARAPAPVAIAPAPAPPAPIAPATAPAVDPAAASSSSTAVQRPPRRAVSSPLPASGVAALAPTMPAEALAPAVALQAPAPAPPGSPAVPAVLEDQLLAAAQDALRRADLEQALALAGDHARLYPDGKLSEDREAIAIESLIRLGRTDAARVRLQPFLERFPRSAFRARFESATGDPPRR